MCPPQTCEAHESLHKTLNQTYNVQSFIIFSYCLKDRSLFLMDVKDQILQNNISVAGKIISSILLHKKFLQFDRL